MVGVAIFNVVFNNQAIVELTLQIGSLERFNYK